jgi:hypothetical protein
MSTPSDSPAEVQSPPPAPAPQPMSQDEPRRELIRLADALARRSSPRLLMEFLRLRRALRSS